MKRDMRVGPWLAMLAVLAVIATVAAPAFARITEEDPAYESLQAMANEALARLRDRGVDPATLGGFRGPVGRFDFPDIEGPGAVLTVGNFFMKVTNNGFSGNPFTNLSSDPSGQWPGASGIEYLNFLALSVGAVNPAATDPVAIRRVSYATEWRPPTLEPEDRMYRAYDGIVGGSRFVNDDGDFDPVTGDPRIDEDFFDGRDNDGDGAIDEDFAAIGQQVYTCVMRDDTPQAINAPARERHVPLGLEVRQTAWAYSIPGYSNFNVVNYQIFNRSGHELDSVAVGFLVDMDCGPTDKGNYFSDDFDVPSFPHGDFSIQTSASDGRLQDPDHRLDVPGVDPDSALCTHYFVRVNGFSVADDDGDDNRTTGVPSFFLIDHTTDPTGQNGPNKVGFRAFRSFTAQQQYAQGGRPRLDQQEFELMTAVDPSVIRNLDPETGFINATPGDQKGDYQAYCSVGPWRVLAADQSISVTVGVGVQEGTYRKLQEYTTDYAKYQTYLATNGACAACLSGAELLNKYPGLDNALSAQVAFEGSYDQTQWPALTDFHGRETGIKAPLGQTLFISSVNPNCDDRNAVPRVVNSQQWSWFDYDCDFCTGAFTTNSGGIGLFHRTWLAESPPPNPNTNTSATYNYPANPDRLFPPEGDDQVRLAWDNLAELTPDPKSGWFDFRGYRIWKASNWTRPVGASGPAEDDWTMFAEFRLFDYADSNYSINASGDSICPRLYVPAAGESLKICLKRGDLWNRQTGQILRPDPHVDCVRGTNGDCIEVRGGINGTQPVVQQFRTRYPIGRYQFVDREVKNGFLYFYSITSFDSTGSGDVKQELGGRRSAVESEGVTPQVAAKSDAKGVWVVPNPYRGTRLLSERPSSWDLTPNSTDPTGTHIDFMGLPRGKWTIKIFTVSGDLVAELRSTDPVNESIRGTIRDANGNAVPGYNLQQDTVNDGQARWNLISRNGQDIVSGIYLFTVESGKDTQRGKFVVIR